MIFFLSNKVDLELIFVLPATKVIEGETERSHFPSSRGHVLSNFEVLHQTYIQIHKSWTRASL